MITDTIEPVSAPPEPKRANLMLHHGSHLATREDVAITPTPRATQTWRPIPHDHLLQTVEKALLEQGLTVQGQAHGLSHDGARYFGLLEVYTPHSETTRVVGIRNAHDMRFAAGIVAGSSVLICDNLCFAGEIALARKHTIGILRDLPDLVGEAVGKLSRYWDAHTQRVHRYKSVGLSDVRAHDLMVRSVDTGVMANSYVPKVLQEWREPSHDAFDPRTLWSLQNAFTEVFKGRVDLFLNVARSCTSCLICMLG